MLEPGVVREPENLPEEGIALNLGQLAAISSLSFSEWIAFTLGSGKVLIEAGEDRFDLRVGNVPEAGEVTSLSADAVAVDGKQLARGTKAASVCVPPSSNMVAEKFGSLRIGLEYGLTCVGLDGVPGSGSRCGWDVTAGRCGRDGSRVGDLVPR